MIAMNDLGHGTRFTFTGCDYQGLADVTRIAFARHFRLFDQRDRISIDPSPAQIRLQYLSSRTSAISDSATCIQLRIDLHDDLMWIHNVQVAPALRGQGLGRELVTASERLVSPMGISLIRVYPLISAVGFWESLSYKPVAHISRVLQKRIASKILEETAAETATNAFFDRVVVDFL
jgi:GNAT superfamily N-acetyltransferase